MACSASEIYAARSSIVGSIGVIGGGFGFVEVAEKIGVGPFFNLRVLVILSRSREGFSQLGSVNPRWILFSL